MMMMLTVRYSLLQARELLKAASILEIIIVLERATHTRIVRDIRAKGSQSNYSFVLLLQQQG
jgi:hypothetical protein